MDGINYNQYTQNNRAILEVLENMKKIKNDILIFLISMLISIPLYIFSMLLVSPLIFPSQQSNNSAGPSINSLSSILSNTSLLLLVEVIAIILIIIGAYKLRKGFDGLLRFRENLKIGKTGSLIIIIGMIILAIGYIIGVFMIRSFIANVINSLQSASAGSGIPLLSSLSIIILFVSISGLGGLISFIGNALLSIGFYRLSKSVKSKLMKIGSILNIFLGPVGMIILFIGMHRTIKNVSERYGIE